MIVIGEKLNSSIPSVKKLMDAEDFGGIRELVLKQRDCGAAYIDVNTALCPDEKAMMKNICSVVLEETDCGIMIDSPDAAVLNDVLAFIRSKDSGRPIIVNSVTVNERHECIDIAKEYGAGIVVLLTDHTGIPDSSDKRAENAKNMVALLTDKGFAKDDIYIDIIAESVAVNDQAAAIGLDTVAKIKGLGCHILCGLSNISFGLPKRKYVNAAFMAIACYNGMDSVICDPLSEELRGAYMSADMLCGNDDFCMEYIDAFRA